MATQLCVAVLKKAGRLQQAKFDFLIRGARAPTQLNPLKELLSETAWAAVQGLKVGFCGLPSNCCCVSGGAAC